MHHLRRHGDEADEAQREQAQQTGREQSAQALRDASLERAGELAQLARLAESRRTIELNYFSQEAAQ